MLRALRRARPRPRAPLAGAALVLALAGCLGRGSSSLASDARADRLGGRRAAWSNGTRGPSAARGVSDSVTARPLGFRTGRADAPLLVVEFTDFGCHYCGDFAREVFPLVAREYVATGRVQWRLVPLATASTPHALDAAAAIVCAGQVERAWPMHDALFARQREWVHVGAPEPRFIRIAGETGLDPQRFGQCLQARATRDTVDAMRRLAHQMGVRIAPTFFVGGRRVEGALAIDDVRAILDGVR